jgi:hypothetical protein
MTKSGSRGKPLETSFGPARTLRAKPVNHQVTKFTGESIGSSEQDAIDNGCPTNSRPECEEQRMINASGCTEVMFRNRCTIGIVVNCD